jgi:DNA-directed RNA polymerase subunit RPC12/RpoP
MDVNFQCPECHQELTVDAAGAGSQIECPTCGSRIQIPAPDPTNLHVGNPILASAAAKEDRHFSVPQHAMPADALIAKPLASLDVTAKTTDKQLRVKTIKRSDCVEVGKDHFDEMVTKFLTKVGEENIIGIHPVSCAHQDLNSREWVNDFGVLIVYRG